VTPTAPESTATHPTEEVSLPSTNILTGQNTRFYVLNKNTEHFEAYGYIQDSAKLK
jgi:hypothetical protein